MRKYLIDEFILNIASLKLVVLETLDLGDSFGQYQMVVDHQKPILFNWSDPEWLVDSYFSDGLKPPVSEFPVFHGTISSEDEDTPGAPHVAKEVSNKLPTGKCCFFGDFKQSFLLMVIHS